MESADSSAMLLPPTLTASDSGRSRVPPQSGQGTSRHVALHLLAHPVGVGIAVAPLQPRHDTFELGVVAAQRAVTIAVLDVHAPGAGTVQEDLVLLP